jgi:hypothetical protein
VVKRFQSLTVHPQLYLPTLREEEKEQLEKKHYVISKQWMTNKSKSYWGKIITRNRDVIQQKILGRKEILAEDDVREEQVFYMQKRV